MYIHYTYNNNVAEILGRGLDTPPSLYKTGGLHSSYCHYIKTNRASQRNL